MFEPARTHVPTPDFATLTAPVPLSTINAASVLLPVFVPVRLSVRVSAPVLYASAPVFVKLIAPEPEASSSASESVPESA